MFQESICQLSNPTVKSTALIFDIDFSLIVPRDLYINGLDRWTDGPQSDRIRFPFFLFEIRNPKNKYQILIIAHQKQLKPVK